MDKIKVFISTSGDESQGYTFTENNFKSIKFSNQLMDTSFDINPSVIEQYAEIVFKDKDGTITELVKSGILTKYLKVYVYINNVWTYTYLTSTWDIQAQNTTVTLHCNDPVKKLENIQMNAEYIGDAYLYQLITKAFNAAGYSFYVPDINVSLIITRIYMRDTYIKCQDILTFLNKLCCVGFLRIYWKKNRFVIERCL